MTASRAPGAHGPPPQHSRATPRVQSVQQDPIATPWVPAPTPASCALLERTAIPRAAIRAQRVHPAPTPAAREARRAHPRMQGRRLCPTQITGVQSACPLTQPASHHQLKNCCWDPLRRNHALLEHTAGATQPHVLHVHLERIRQLSAQQLTPPVRRAPLDPTLPPVDPLNAPDVVLECTARRLDRAPARLANPVPWARTLQ
jgi:hypothetical protein